MCAERKIKIRERAESIIWRDSSGMKMRIRSMSTNHIINVVNCLEGKGKRLMPDLYFNRTREQWLRIFTLELDRRKLKSK